MGKVPGKVGFDQPTHPQGKTSSTKNKSGVGFQQNPHTGKAGKTSSAKNKSNVGFSQPAHAKGGTSSAKNPAKVGFDQPNPSGKTVKMPKAQAKNVGKGAKTKKAKKVGPPFKSLDDVMAYRKQNYGA